MMQFVKNMFMYGTTYTYTNLSRLFIRLFVGVMFLQFGIRQIVNFDAVAHNFSMVYGMSSETTLIVMICIEIGCSAFIMLGFLTRLATLPALFSMLIAVDRLTVDKVVLPEALGVTDPVFLPIMFIGIFIYILLAGPGKVSLDYLISLHLINRSKNFEDDEILKEA